MGEEEIVAAEKKCEAIWDYCFSIANTPKYLNKILNYETKIENKEKNTLENSSERKNFNTEII